MTNPNNAVGTNGAFGGRTSVNAFNDVLALVSKGVVSGWACSPSSGMTVQLGGVAGTRDVAVAEDNAGNKTTVNNISGSPIEVTIANASTTDNMIDYIVAYVSNPPSGDEDVADNPSACGIISVRGASANTAPTASAIRSAITADGGTGTLAYYVVLAQISVTAGLTTITNDNISAVDVSGVGSNNIDWATLKQPLIFGTESSITLTTSQQTLITTSTIPAGKYVALVRVGLVGNGDTSAFDYLARVTDVSGNLIGELSAAKNRAASYEDFLYFQSLVQLQSNMKLYLKVWRNTGSGLAKAGKNGVYNSTNIILIPIQ